MPNSGGDGSGGGGGGNNVVHQLIFFYFAVSIFLVQLCGVRNLYLGIKRRQYKLMSQNILFESYWKLKRRYLPIHYYHIHILILYKMHQQPADVL